MSGAHAAVSVRLEEEFCVEAHDRFILRSLSPVATIGGGVILDVRPRRWHSRADHVVFVKALHDGELAGAALAAARDGAGVASNDLLSAGVSAETLAGVLDALTEDGRMEVLSSGVAPAKSLVAGFVEEKRVADDLVGRRWFTPGTLAALSGNLLAAVERRGKDRPEQPFSPATELIALTPSVPEASVTALIGCLVADSKLVPGEGGYASPLSVGLLDPGQEALTRELLLQFGNAPVALCSSAMLADVFVRPRAEIERLLKVLARRGEIVRVSKDLWSRSAGVDEARRRLKEALSRDGEITLAGFRDRLGIGRRSAQALLELFDSEGLTRRHGDVRVARTRHP